MSGWVHQMKATGPHTDTEGPATVRVCAAVFMHCDEPVQFVSDPKSVRAAKKRAAAKVHAALKRMDVVRSNPA